MVAISDRYRAYALDWWGFGDSDKSKPRYTVSDYVLLLDRFVDKMGIRQAPLIGHALGAIVALEYAAGYPERVNKLMAVNLPLRPDCIHRKLRSYANNSLLAKILRWQPQAIYQEVQQEIEKASAEAIRMSLRSAGQIDVPSRLRSLSQNKQLMLLAVCGEKDDVIDPTPTSHLNGNWSNIRPIGLAESKHFPMLDEAARFNRLLNDFLEVGDNLSILELKTEWRRRTR